MSQELIGRRIETGRITSLLDSLPSAGAALLVTGEPGIGKTALLDYCERLARKRSMVALSIRASEAEVHLPFATLQGLLHPVESASVRLRPRLRGALESALGLGEGPPPDVFLVGLAVLQLLSDVGEGTGVVAAVDDSQWMDPSTAQVMAFVSRRVRTDPVVLVFGQRSGLSSPLDGTELPTMHLGPLEAEDVSALLLSHRPDLDVDGRRQITEWARGNPLALLELSAGDGSVAVGEPRMLLGDRLRRSFSGRWTGLSPSAHAVLLVVTASDGAAIEEILAAATFLDDHGQTPVHALDELIDTGSMTVVGGHVRFRHPLIRSAVIETVSPEDLRAAHAALGATLVSPDRAAWHLAAATSGPDERVARAMDDVAARARGRGDLAVEHRALSQASALSEDAGSRSRRLLRASGTAIELGRPEVAHQLVEQLDASDLNAIDSARLALLRDSLDPTVHSQGRVDLLARHALTAVRADPDLSAALLMAAGVHLTTASFGLDPGSSDRAARALAEHLGRDDSRVVAVFAVIDPRANTERVRERLTAFDVHSFDVRDELLVNATAFVMDADATLARLQSAVIERFRTRGQLRSVASLRVIHTWTAITLADWPQALLAAEEGVRLSQDAGSAQWESGSIIALAIIAAFRGDSAGAATAIRAAEALASTRGAQDVLTGVQLTRGVDHIARREYDEATSALKRSFDPEDAAYHPVQSPWCLGDLAQAASHSGRIDEVRPIIDSYRTSPAFTPWHRMAVEYAKPFVLTDTAEVEASFRAALAGVVSGWPTYRIRMIIEYGSWLRRRRRLGEAKERLRVGRDQADTYGLHPWSRLARNELRAMGEESAVAPAATWEQLSPQELHVARLASVGLSNREIGERLFLSHRTVGSHLYRIFPKLGVTNRAQLASAIGPSLGDQSEGR